MLILGIASIVLAYAACDFIACGPLDFTMREIIAYLPAIEETDFSAVRGFRVGTNDKKEARAKGTRSCFRQLLAANRGLDA